MFLSLEKEASPKEGARFYEAFISKVKKNFLSSPALIFPKTLWIGVHLKHLPADYVFSDYLYNNVLIHILQVLFKGISFLSF
nr:MAG TPA: hypothetical protein [Caudoviricetes sp.]